MGRAEFLPKARAFANVTSACVFLLVDIGELLSEAFSLRYVVEPLLPPAQQCEVRGVHAEAGKEVIRRRVPCEMGRHKEVSSTSVRLVRFFKEPRGSSGATTTLRLLGGRLYHASASRDNLERYRGQLSCTLRGHAPAAPLVMSWRAYHLVYTMWNNEGVQMGKYGGFGCGGLPAEEIASSADDYLQSRAREPPRLGYRLTGGNSEGPLLFEVTPPQRLT